jgi:hypothetical protein
MSLVMKNNVVACFPFDPPKNEATARNSLALIKQSLSLTLMQPLVGTEIGDSGIYVSEEDAIYIRDNCRNQPWAKELYTMDLICARGDELVKFILVPLSEIVMVARGYFKEEECEGCDNCKEEKKTEPKVN